MRRFFTILLLINVLFISSLSASDAHKKAKKKDVTQKNIEKAIEQEKKFAKEQKFYKGKEYDLKSNEVDEKTIESVPDIKPDYDFDITDVYRDDI